MDKKIILAVAGSGKTTSLISRLDLVKRFLIITYSDNNDETLRRKIIERFSFHPQNVVVLTYFTFLHSFCYRPFLYLEMGKTSGLNFNEPPEWTRKLNRNNEKFYLDASRRLYHNRLAKLLLTKNLMSDVRDRIEKYFDALYIDEVQDFGGNDFNFLMEIVKSEVEVTLVGDFFQSTYTTSRDGPVNKNLHKDIETYLGHFRTCKLNIDRQSLVKSHRCSIAVCDFIRSQMGIEIHSHSIAEKTVMNIDSQHEADQIYSNEGVVKLFYQEHARYSCYSQNWGNSKGQDHYDDVCVVLNGTTFKAYQKGSLRELAPLTKNKLYVACSRARGNLYFTSENMYKNLKSTS